MKNKLILSLLTPRKNNRKILSVENNIINYFFSSNPAQLERDIDEITSHKKLQHFFRPLKVKDLKNDSKILKFGNLLTLEKFFIYYYSIFKSNEEKIESHKSFTSDIDLDILMGNFNSASHKIDIYIDKFGENFWAVRTKMFLYSSEVNSKKLTSYYNEKISEIDNVIYKHMISKCFWLQQANDTKITLEKAVLSDIKDFEVDLKPFGDLISLAFIPPELQRISFKESLTYMEEFPLLDIYEFLSLYIFHLDENYIREKNLKNLFCFLRKMEEKHPIKFDKNTLDLPEEIKNTKIFKNTNTAIEDIITNTAKLSSNLGIEFITKKSPIYQILNKSIRIIKQKENTTQEIRDLEGLIIRLYKNPNSYHFLKILDQLLPNHIEKSFEIKRKTSNFFQKKNKSTDVSITKKDKIEETIKKLLVDKEYHLAIDFCAKRLLENESLYISLPLKDLSFFIKKNNVLSIDAMIILSFSSRLISPDYDQVLNEIFEDYLEDKNIDSPVELLDENYFLSDKRIYFLEQICIPNHLDCLSKFESSEELFLERVIILFYLEERIKKKKYIAECEEIFKTIIAKRNSSKIENNKISININSIKSNKLDAITPLIEVFLSSKDEEDTQSFITLKSEVLDNKKENPSNVQEENSTVILTGSKDSILIKLVSQISNSYLYDEDYGLDNCLSAEIRHGFLGNKMRSRAENLNILIETDLDETFWTLHYNHLDNEYSELANALLKEFSIKFNKTISKIEEKIKISQDGKYIDRFFHYAFQINDIDRIRDYIKIETSNSEIFDEIIRILDEKTSDNLEKTREYINTIFRQEIYKCIEELELSLNKASTHHFNEIVRNISSLKHGIGEDINEISEWFHLGKKDTLDTLSLTDLLHTADEYFKKIRKSKFTNIIKSNSNRKLNGIESKELIFVLINLMNNSRDHGRKNSEIRIEAKEEENQTIIKISNKIDDKKIDINKIKERVINKEEPNYKNKEGGTGLHRSYWTLKDLNSQYNLDFFIDKSEFTVEISLHHESTHC